MNPRERVLAAVHGAEVFPVPVDVMENLIHPGLAAGLRRHFGLASEDHAGLLRALGAELRWGKPAYVGPPLEVAPIQPPCTFPLKKATRNIWGGWSGSNTWSAEFERPLRSVETAADVHDHAWPEPDWFDYSQVGCWHDEIPLPVSQWAERERDYARVAGGFEPVFGRIMDLCGMEEGLSLMAARPDLVHALVGHIGEFYEEYYRRLARAGRGYIDFLAFGDDFAGQDGMLLSPAKWREYFLPLWHRLFDIAHRGGMGALMHMCGAVRPVLGDLVDAGLDVFEVVQVTAVGMEPAELKREFGTHLTFYGGMDTQGILPFGRPAEVREEVRRLVETLGRGGRYIFSSMHILLDDVPVENALAMHEEAGDYRKLR